MSRAELQVLESILGVETPPALSWEETRTLLGEHRHADDDDEREHQEEQGYLFYLSI